MARPLALFGGTFDPVHLGHLRAVWEAAEALQAEVKLMPVALPPHRPPPVASARQRLAMLRAVLTGQDRLGLDTRELDREGPSWSVDSLLEVRREIGSRRPLVLLLGRDAFAGLPTWHRWRQLFELAHLGVLTRPGVPIRVSEELEIEVAARRRDTVSALLEQAAGGVLTIPITALDISATHIRALLRAGQEPRFLLPDTLLVDPRLLEVYRHRGDGC